MNQAAPAGVRAAKKSVVAKGHRGATAGGLGSSADIVGDALFNDGKDDGALRTIGEVAQALGLRQHVLRYWEEHFPMLRPLTRAGGRRYYRPADIALLVEIDRLLHREGYTIRGARQTLARPLPHRAAVVAGAPVVGDIPVGAEGDAPPEQTLVAALSVLRQHLETIRTRLARALSET